MAGSKIWDTGYFCDLLQEQGITIPENLINVSFDLLSMPDCTGVIKWECRASVEVIKAFLQAYIAVQVKEKLNNAT